MTAVWKSIAQNVFSSSQSLSFFGTVLDLCDFYIKASIFSNHLVTNQNIKPWFSFPISARALQWSVGPLPSSCWAQWLFHREKSAMWEVAKDVVNWNSTLSTRLVFFCVRKYNIEIALLVKSLWVGYIVCMWCPALLLIRNSIP